MSPVRGFYSSIEPIFQIGLGENKIVDLIEIIWPEGKHQFLENINANQRITVDIENAKDGKIIGKPARPLYFEKIEKKYFTHSENEFEDFNVQFLLPHRHSRLGPALATADVNGDGLTDFYIGGAYGQAGVLFFQNDKGGFNKSNNNFEKTYEETGALFFDADNDGDNDLYIASGGNAIPVGNVSVDHQLYLNDGKRKFFKRP